MQQLNLKQRYQIQILMSDGLTKKAIAERLQIHRSTLFRELKRNQIGEVYHAEQAESQRKVRYKGQKMKIVGKVAARICRLLVKEQWSPEQIAGEGKLAGRKPISHEAIYQFIYRDAQNAGSLFEHLRHRKKRRQKRSAAYNYRGQIKGRISIEQRPKAAEEKIEFGHLEADTVVGKGHSGRIVTVVDKRSMRIEARLVASGEAEIVTKALISILKKWKIPPKSLTVDNGKEFAYHTKITEKTKVPIYFCHPYASYERGLNENHNGLLRQYFPKNQCFSAYTQADLDQAIHKLNNRPRKSLGFLSPNAYFSKTKKLERNPRNVALLC
jgi:transposase, IS30 family